MGDLISDANEREALRARCELLEAECARMRAAVNRPQGPAGNGEAPSRAPGDELAEKEKRLASLFRAAPIGIGLSLGRTIVETNRRLCEILGYGPAEIIGMKTRTFYKNDVEYDMAGAILARQELQFGSGLIETQWVRRDGTAIDVLIGTAPLVPGDLSKGVTLTVIDVSEGKRAEAERHALELRVQQGQKLESLGILAGGVAHEFNNILLAILGNAELAMMDLDEGSSVRGNITEIEKASRKAADLCRQMLAYAGKGRFMIEPLDASDVIREMEHLLKGSISRKAALKLSLRRPLPQVEADGAQLQQVVRNLVVNASEALGDECGTISVATDVAEISGGALQGVYGDASLSDGRYVVIRVSDTGCGMDEPTRARVFEPFFSTKFTGRGLGLPAVLGIVRGHKGAITIESSPGKGSVVAAYFPAVARDRSAAHP